jgi:uncharacterized UPF0146 family protein
MIYRNTIILYSIRASIGILSYIIYIIENVLIHFEILGSSVLFDRNLFLT